jgi:molybdopterin synthase sulfur carrier subunit
MLKVLFFGQLKEVLKTSAIELDWHQDKQNVDSVSKLRLLLQGKDENWHQHMQGGKVLVAVNQELVQDHHVITDGDEIAFFPPVTGG